MAIMFVRAQVISRGAGRSVVSAAAYRHRTRMEEEQTGMSFRYEGGKAELVHEELALPDQTLCCFYGVDSWEALVAAQEEHVLKLQDAARRNVKPWEDTFPPTLLPKYLRESGLDAPRALPVGLPVAEFAEAFDQLNSRTERAKHSDLIAPPSQPVALPDGSPLWLWKNGNHFLAFAHEFPCFADGDPMTLGEPFGKAVFRKSEGRS